MSKEEFLQTLREALAGEVPEGLIQENVQYYDQYITAEMRKGRTAQNIIEELGGPRIIAKTIIDASEAAGQKMCIRDRDMAIVKPFRGIRPAAAVASKVAALPYDVYNRKEACEEVKKNPLSFLNIDRAETQFPDEVDTYDPQVYEKARELLEARVKAVSYTHLDVYKRQE